MNFPRPKPVSLLIMAIVLTPTIRANLPVPLRVDDFLVIVLTARLIGSRKFTTSFSALAFLGLFASAVLSLSLAIVGGERMSFSEANTSLVLLRLSLIAFVVPNYLKSAADVRQCLHAFYFAMCGSMVVGFIQLARVEPYVSIFFGLFSDHYQRMYIDEARMGHIFRVIATMGNPNHAAMFFVAGCIACLGMLTDPKAPQGTLIRLAKCGTVAGFVFLILVGFSSRTGLVLAVACTPIYLMAFSFFSKGASQGLNRMVMGSVLTGVLLVGVYSAIPQRMLPERVRDFVSSDRGAHGRVAELRRSRFGNWEQGLQRIERKGKWLFGIGPKLDVVIDNGHLQLLYSQGLLGLLLALGLWTWPLRTMAQLRMLPTPHVLATVFTIYAAFALYSFTSPVLFAPKLGPALAVFMGVWQAMLNAVHLRRRAPAKQAAQYATSRTSTAVV